LIKKTYLKLVPIDREPLDITDWCVF
jgi:hypothetical protein